MSNTNQRQFITLKIAGSVLFALLTIGLYPSSIARAAPVNLIPNGSLDTPSVDPTVPSQWNKGGYGTNNRIFTYPVAGVNGGKAASVSITSYTDGDAKWYFNDVPITPGRQYSFQDAYMATAPTLLAIQYTNASGTTSFDPNFVVIPAASSTWASADANFTPPTGAVSVTIYHLLGSVGSLTITNYSLIEIPPPTPFAQGFVSLTFDDGRKSQIDNVKSILDASNMKATFYIVTHASAGFAAPSSLSVLADTIYTYSDEYTSSSTNEVAARVTLTDDSVVDAEVVDDAGNTLGTSAPFAPASSWSSAAANFYLPPNAKSVTIIHRSTSGGSISVQNVLFGAKDYMTRQDVLNLQSDGQEIGAHTQTHPDLTSLTINEATNQIVGSRSELLAGGITPVVSFNYPYGAFNADVKQIVQNAGFSSARTVVSGSNGQDADPFALLAKSVDASTTLSQVQSWVEDARTNKLWLVLVFHDIVANTIDNPFGATPETLQDIVNYLSGNDIPVTTVGQGLALISGTTTPPVIIPTTTTKTMSLSTGWNLITMSVQPISATTGAAVNYTAETFGQLAGADEVKRWDTGSQQYVSHTVGQLANDFTLTNGEGYFVRVSAAKNVSITGVDISQSAATLPQGWSLSGWYNSADTTAETIGQSNQADVVSVYNGVAQQWTTHIVGLPLNNFNVKQGDGLFIHKASSTIPAVSANFDKARVTITFDDGFESNVDTVMPVLDQYGFKVTYCYATMYVEGLSDQEANALSIANRGHETCSHTVNHLDLTLETSTTTLAYELSHSQSFLQSLIGQPVTSFATPFGAYNESVNSEIAKYYLAHRTTDEGYNLKSGFNQYQLQAMNMQTSTTMTQFQNWVNTAKANKAWLILTYHVVDNGDDLTQYDTYKADFDAQMAWLATSGVSVQTMKQALSEIQPQL